MKNACRGLYQLVRLGAVILLYAPHGRLKNVLWANSSAIIESTRNLNWDIGKYLSSEGENGFQFKRICCIKLILVRILSINFCRRTISRGGFYRPSSCTDGNWCIPMISPKSILLVCFLLLASVSPLLLSVFVSAYGRIDCGAERSRWMFSDVA